MKLSSTLISLASVVTFSSASPLFNAPAALTTCQNIAKNVSSASAMYYFGTFEYGNDVQHWMTSSSNFTPACVFEPGTAQDLGNAIKIIGSAKTPFAVQAGGHASNAGFSSTQGVHINLKRFSQTVLSADKSTVEIGPGQYWDTVYSSLKGTGKIVVGGRVAGVGVGGFAFGGGGYSWYTNQYGLTIDNIISATVVQADGSVVTASETQNSDLFWAIRGGGNDFGIVTSFTMIARDQTPNIYGGLAVYPATSIPALINAVIEFDKTNTNPKAQVIYTQNTLIGAKLPFVLYFFDGPDPGTAFDAFKGIPAVVDGRKAQPFSDMVASVPSQIQGGSRGAFAALPVAAYTPGVMAAILNQTNYLAKQSLLFSNSGTFCSYDIEPFLKTSVNSNNGGAWPHNQPFRPTNLYCAWVSPTEDQFWNQQMAQSTQIVREAALAEGQAIQNAPYYPNYALAFTPLETMYQDNLPRLRAIKKQLDPNNVFGLAGGFKFAT